MASRVSEEKYNAMISALKTFAGNISNAMDNMQSLASNCTQALGSSDKAVAEISSKIRSCQLKYLNACKQALAIAKAMQDELDEQKKEDDVWTSEE